jgi:hypothetical protein
MRGVIPFGHRFRWVQCEGRVSQLPPFASRSFKKQTCTLRLPGGQSSPDCNPSKGRRSSRSMRRKGQLIAKNGGRLFDNRLNHSKDTSPTFRPHYLLSLASQIPQGGRLRLPIRSAVRVDPGEQMVGGSEWSDDWHQAEDVFGSNMQVGMAEWKAFCAERL